VNVATVRGDVLLREPVPDVDGPIIDAWYAGDPDGAWNVFLERPSHPQREILVAAIESQEHRYWVIEAGTQVGIVRLSTKGRAPGHAALLYYVASAHRGQRHATRALAMVVRHAFDELGFEALLADVLLANERSGRLLESLGFERTGDRTLARSDRGPQQLEEWRLKRRNSPAKS
jgi:RimJ/RimL family protein N-acetyltransferase